MLKVSHTRDERANGEVFILELGEATDEGHLFHGVAGGHLI